MGSFWSEFALYLGPLCLVCAGLLFGFIRVAARERRLFDHLARHPGDRASRIASSPWLEWVDGAFSAGSAGGGRLTRQDVVDEFDARMLSCLPYQGLQRLAVAAPLFGVIITTAKFVSYDVPATANPSLGELLQTAAGPLFVGVGTGATLALACQLGLLLANRSLANARFSALRWFDSHVWQGINPPGHSSTLQMIEAMGRFAAALGDASQRHDLAARSLESAATGINQAAQDFAGNADRMGKDFDAMTRRLSGGVEELARVCRALEPLVGQIPGLLERLDQAGKAIGHFDEAVRNRFDPAAITLGRATKGFEAWSGELRSQQAQVAESIGRLLASSAALDSAAATFNRVVLACNDGADSFGQSVGQLGHIMQRFDAASRGLQDFEENAIRPVQRSFTGLDTILRQLSGTSDDLRKLLDMQPQVLPLLQGLERATLVAGEINNLPAQVRTALDSMQQDLASSARGAGQEAGRAVKAALDQQTQAIKQAQESIDKMPLQLAQSLERLRAQLEQFSHALLIDQADCLETTLQQILVKMDGRKGRIRKN